jgi:type I restriction enzyme S subunit
MKSNYKRLGDYIRQVNIKNSDLEVDNLLGVSITKEFIPSIANTIGTDMSKYKIVKKNQFTYGSITSRNGDKISIALLSDDEAIVSTSYTVFEIIDTDILLPEYLMMWFRREEFDRYARYMSHGSTREAFGWEEMCDVRLPVPSLSKQQEIVKEYHTIIDRIKLNEELNQKLEDTAQTIYKEWFIVNNIDTNLKLLSDIIIEIIDNRGKTPKWTLEGIPLVEANAINTNQPFINLSKVQKFVTKEVYSNAFRSGHPKEKDILIVTVGSSIGSIAIASNDIFSIAQNIIAIRTKKGFSHYLFEMLKYRKNDLLSLDIGSAQSSIKVPHLLSMEINLPSSKLIFKFEDIVSKIYSKILINQKQIINLKNLKQILLSKLATIED